jgi:hypothetical protein
MSSKATCTAQWVGMVGVLGLLQPCVARCVWLSVLIAKRNIVL